MTACHAMGRTYSLILRETGLALAVLALWLLTLLAPLHQASGLLRELSRAGIDTGAAWRICLTADPSLDGSDHALPVCPAQGIGKSDVILPPPLAFALAVMGLQVALLLPVPPPAVVLDPRLHPGQPRAPPALI